MEDAPLNQSPPRVDVDEFSENAPLFEAVERHGAGWASKDLKEVGRVVGSGTFQEWAELANTNPPQLEAYDRYGARIDEVRYHPAYHSVISEAVGHGAHASAWDDPRAGAHVARAACFMLFAQVEPGHACPVSMTYSAVPTLRAEPDMAARWEPLITRNGYAPGLARPEDKPGVLFGMAMTEKQGGSDLRANTTTALATTTGGRGGEYLLDGHKWFCSAPMSDAFLVLAKTEDGSTCFLVPRVLDDGARNTFRIQRLKDKLGNRSNASAELELSGTIGFMVGPPGRGIATIIEMVNHTRLDCILGTAAGMRQAVCEAVWHGRHREAFGRLLVDQPIMENVLADLSLEYEAAVTAGVRLARAYDADADETERSFRRIATAITKYWVCKRGPHHAYEALECLGGNGYCETFPLARRYREQPVMSVWEGSGNVICLDVLRAAAREPKSLEAFFSEVELASGSDRTLDERVSKLKGELTDPASLEARARFVVEELALVLQASLLVRFAPTEVADAFCAGRLSPERALQFGTLPPWTARRAIVDRHLPSVA